MGKKISVIANKSVKYLLLFVAAVVGYLLLNWLVSWSLYGLANLFHSHSLMEWLDCDNHFAPAGTILDDWNEVISDTIGISRDSMWSSRQSFEEAVVYLETKDEWRKEEMEAIESLQGMFDELIRFDRKALEKRRSELGKSNRYTAIVENLQALDKGKFLSRLYLQTLNRKRLTYISPIDYISFLIKMEARHDSIENLVQNVDLDSILSFGP